MGFRERMEDPGFAFEFATEEDALLFTAYGKSEDNDNCYLITAPLYENPKNLAMYYMEEMGDVLRFMQDVYELDEQALDEVISEAVSVEETEELNVFDVSLGDDAESEESESEDLTGDGDGGFVPGEMDEAAEFGDA